MWSPDSNERGDTLNYIASVSDGMSRIQPAHAMRDDMDSISHTSLSQNLGGELITALLNGSNWIDLWLDDRFASVTQVRSDAIEIVYDRREAREEIPESEKTVS